MRRRLVDTGSDTVRHLRDKILDRKPLSIHFRVVDGHPAPYESTSPKTSGLWVSQATEPQLEDGSVYRTRWWA